MGYKDPAKQREYQRLRAACIRTVTLIQLGACSKCGSNSDLELHHVDPALKISHNVWSWSLAKRKAELQKCIVLCELCHRAHHVQKYHALRRHGTSTMYRLGCRCYECKQSHNKRMRDYNALKLTV